MPISSDPNDTFPVHLQGDNSATFHMRFLTCKEVWKVTRLITEALAEKNNEKASSLMEEAIGIGLVRHEGVTVRGEPVAADAKPAEYLSPSELIELAHLTHISPAEEEVRRKKVSASQQGLTQASSASDAPAASV